MANQALTNYLNRLLDIRSSGSNVDEISFYPALSQLLNEVGSDLKPKVKCVMNLKNVGAGLPDGGLFTEDQIKRQRPDDAILQQKPARGAIEVKGTKPELKQIVEGEQVARYVREYGQVLATNLRQFAIVTLNGKEIKLGESFSLGDSESAFWKSAQHPQKMSKELGDGFREYLQRVMRQNVPLTNPQDVAWFLASSAREAKRRVEASAHLAGLQSLRQALEEALGMKFQGKDGEHFFQATLVQTLFYGLFSAWALWRRDNSGRFDWHSAQWFLHVPMIGTLFEQISQPGKLKPLHLEEVLDWTGDVLNRVEWTEFNKKFESEHAVQYFYEPFLKAYDPELRKSLGVWYTPPEIVKYQVARVDRVLREELNIEDGLADPQVIVLDPCCGTGAYLVEVLNAIHDTLKEKGTDAGLAHRLKKAAIERVFGFEILPAPFVISHLQLGLLLHRLGAPLDDKEKDRVGVYLTNALTGWEPPKGVGKEKVVQASFDSALDEEVRAARRIKQDSSILVIIGNPPYNAFAGTSPKEEEGLVDAYKVGLTKPASQGGWGIKKFNLDDLYVRFFRIAENRINKTGKGVVSFISNHSWVSEPSFVVLRQNLLESFDNFWIENLHGNRKISEYAPDGRTSETIFAIPGFSSGIQQGVVTSLWVKGGSRGRSTAIVKYRDDIDAARAEERRTQLIDSLSHKNADNRYSKATPTEANRFSFRPQLNSDTYSSWPMVPELTLYPPFNGPIERRGNSLIVMQDERGKLDSVADYLNDSISNEQIRAIAPDFMRSSGEFEAEKTRAALSGTIKFISSAITRYPFKVFDTRLAYLDANIAPLFSRPAPQLLAQRSSENAFLITRDTADKTPEGPPFLYSRLVCDYDCISGHARHFPLQVSQQHKRKTAKERKASGDLWNAPKSASANVSQSLGAYFNHILGIRKFDSLEAARTTFRHVLAIGYSPAYLLENADGIRQSWPRIPLPNSKKLLESSAELGSKIAALLDTESAVSGVTSGKIRPELKSIALVTRVSGGPLRIESGDTDLAAGWGHAGKGGVTMPGKGKINQRPYSDEEKKGISAGAESLGLTADQAFKCLGKTTCDIYLNDQAYWRNVPVNVWEYYIGGYQVIKKWLSYRERTLLGRSLTLEEIDYVTEMTRRLTAIVLLQPALDANYEAVKANTYAWPKTQHPKK